MIDVGLFGIWPYPIEASTCDNTTPPAESYIQLAGVVPVPAY
jgi:hypothetical protein